MGWEGLFAGGIEVHEVPGNHTSLLQLPNVEILAEMITQRLAEFSQIISREIESSAK
jgi:thioesterase domain-containing protein